jgi:PAS domain S-box-containing protein
MGVLKMTNEEVNILHVEDDVGTCRLVKRLLTRSNSLLKCTTATTLSSAISCLGKRHFDNVLLEPFLSDSKGLGTIDGILRTDPDVPIIVLSATDDPGIKLQAIGRGVRDYLVKGDDCWQSLISRIWRAIENQNNDYYIPEANHSFRTIFDKMPMPIICISEKGHVMQFNSQAESLWKRRAKDIIGKSFLQNCIPSRDRFRVYMHLMCTLSGDSSEDILTTFFRAGRTRRLLLWSFNCVGKNGDKDNFIIAAVRHITEVAAAEHNLFLTGSKLSASIS